MTNTLFEIDNAETIIAIINYAHTITKTSTPRGMNSLIDEAILHFIDEHQRNCNCPDRDFCIFDDMEHIDRLFAKVQTCIVNRTGAYRAPSAETLEQISDMISVAMNLHHGIRYIRAEHLIAIPEYADVTIKIGQSGGRDFLVTLSDIEPGSHTLSRVHAVIGELLADSTWCEYTHTTTVGSLTVE